MRVGISLRIGSFLTLFLAEIIILMITFSVVMGGHKENVKLLYDHIERSYLVDELRIAFCKLIMPVNDYLIVGGDPREQENFTDLSSEVDKHFFEMEAKGLLFDDYKELLRNLKDSHNQIKELAKEVFDLPNAVGNVEAGALTESVDAVADKAVADAETMHQVTYKQFNRIFQEMQRTENVLDMLILIGAAFNIFLVFAGLVYISRTVTRPITILGALVNEVGKGNLSRRIDINSKDEIGDLAAAFNLMTDNLKLLQQELTQTEKMASLGILAAGVAHELKNPLAIITQGLEYVKRCIPQDDNTRLSFDKLMQSVTRMDIIIKGLLDFSRSSVSEYEVSDVRAVIEDVLTLTEHQLGLKSIKVIRQYDDNIPQLSLDRNKMRQVFLNVIINARDAMPQGGAITILSKEKVAQGRRMAVIEVDDTGCGIPAESLKKVFDPFFTTKQKSGGTGLGLSISRGIVEMHKGSIHMESESGKGTRVIIELPLNYGR